MRPLTVVYGSPGYFSLLSRGYHLSEPFEQYGQWLVAILPAAKG